MVSSSSSSPAGKTTGAVLVLGGGVVGVQAALDMTELGLKVYLAEKSAAIGGVMARLDKTFPTNDCSLCILAPKLVEAGRNPNIDILTNADLLKVTGSPGNFTATIRKRPRYIDEEVCTGCGQCTLYCLKQISDDYNERLCSTHAAHIDYSQAVPTSYHYVAPQDMKTWLESGKELLIVDIQPAKDFSRQHFSGAIETNAFPVESAEEQKRLDLAVSAAKGNARDVVVVCPRGKGGATAPTTI